MRTPARSLLRRPRRVIAAAVAVLAVSAVLTACSDEEADLTVYSGRSEALVGPLFEQFTEETGITLDVRYGDSAELAAAMLEEGDRTPADVFLSQDAGALGAVDTEGLLAPLPDETTAQVPARYRAEDDGWVGVTGRARVIAYNTDEVAADEVPTTIDEVVEPRWKGEVGIAPTNASFQAFVTALRVSRGEEAARTWLEALKANDPQIYDNNIAVLDAVNAGEVSLGLINHYYWFEKAAELGEENLDVALQFTEPGDDGSLVNVSGVGVTRAGSEDPNAQELVTYLLGADAQTYFANETFEYPLAAGVPAAEGLPELDSLRGPQIDLADLASLSATLELLDSVGLT